VADHASGGQGEEFPHEGFEPAFVDFGGLFSVDQDADGFGDADGVRQLDFTGVGQSCGDDIFGNIAGHIAGGAVHLGGVFSAEGAAAVAASSAVGIDDDFSAGQAAIPFGAADFKSSGRVDMKDGVVVNQFFGQNGQDDFFNDFFAGLVGHLIGFFVHDGGIVLGAADDGMNAFWFFVFAVFDSDLAFAVGPQPFDFAGLAQFCKSAGDFVGQIDRQGHIDGGFPAGIAEHQSLVAGSASIDAHGNVGTLLFEGNEDGAVVGIEADGGVGVADFSDGIACELGDIDDGLGGNLAGDERHAGGNKGFAGDAAVGVLGQHGIQNGIGDLVGDFVRMAHGDRFAGE